MFPVVNRVRGLWVGFVWKWKRLVALSGGFGAGQYLEVLGTRISDCLVREQPPKGVQIGELQDGRVVCCRELRWRHLHSPPLTVEDP